MLKENECSKAPKVHKKFLWCSYGGNRWLIQGVSEVSSTIPGSGRLRAKAHGKATWRGGCQDRELCNLLMRSQQVLTYTKYQTEFYLHASANVLLTWNVQSYTGLETLFVFCYSHPWLWLVRLLNDDSTWHEGPQESFSILLPPIASACDLSKISVFKR